jgi:hypothetical protein
MLHFIENCAGYARLGSGLSEEAIQAVVRTAERAVAAGRFFGLNPQFMVTATV